MDTPLGGLSGAAGGMADAVAGIIEQRLRQAQVANQIADTQARQAETQRSHLADEAFRQSQLDATTALRQAAQQQTAAYQQSLLQDRADKQAEAWANTIPAGTTYATDDPTVAQIQKTPYAGLLRTQPGHPDIPVGPIAPGDTSAAMPDAYVKAPSTKELLDAATINKNMRTPTETKTAHDLAIEAALAKPPDQRTPDEVTMIQGRQAFNKLQGEQALNRLNISVNAANARQGTTQTNQATQHEFDEVQKKIDKQTLPRSAETLDAINAGGVGGALAVPLFLSSMVGGVGSGLRMTQSEMNLIQHARPGVEDLGLKLQNIAGNYQSLTDQQKADMTALVRSVAARESRANDLYTLAQTRINNAKSPQEARALLQKLNSDEAALYRGAIGGSAGPAVGTVPGATGTVPARKRYDINGNPIP